jgi:hypothetical protein
MANSNGWGDGAANNAIGWGQGANNAIGWGDIHADSWAGLTDISGAPTTDPDAQAFITAASITDPTQQAAINQLVVDLKGYSIWTKMKALYPFVGGTASSNSYNLKNTAQYQVTWYGGLTHNSNGVTGSINGYGDTFLPNNTMSQNSLHFSIYSRTNAAIIASDIAAWNGSFGSSIYSRGGLGNFNSNNNSTTQANQSVADSLGLFLSTRTSSTQVILQKNATQYTFSNTSTNNISSSFKLLRTGDFNGEYSSRNLAFASIGDGLTDTEAANLYTAVQAFQTTLGRQV